MTTKATVGQTLDLFRKQLGIGEDPDGSNCQPFSHFWHKPCEAWCADCCCYVLKNSGALDVPYSAYTPSLAQGFKDAHRWHDGTAGIRPGDVPFYQWPGSDRICHVEMVESVRSDGSFVALGGNVSNKVMRTVRRNYVVGYGRPTYTTSSKPAPKPNPPASKTPAWYKRELSNQSPMLHDDKEHGHDVSHVQHVVGATPDGEYGPKTAARVKAWQEHHHVQPYDGIVGPITARAMG